MPESKEFKRSCLAIAISQSLFLSANAATITVNSTADNAVADVAGVCTLREAIQSINMAGNQLGCTADISQNPFGTDDTISFDSIVFATSQTITLDSSALIIEADITVNGPGQDQLTLDATNNSRVLQFFGQPADKLGVTLNDLTITGGSASDGGGIYLDQALLEMNYCTVTGNSAVFSGAGINIGGDGSATIINSIISNNLADYGAGIDVASGGSLYLLNSSVSANTANRSGGGIRVYGGSSATLVSSNLNGNSAINNDSDNTTGGALAAGGNAIIELQATNITHNTAQANSAYAYGGGIYASDSSELTITGSVISGNSVLTQQQGEYYRGKGAGINIRYSFLSLIESSIEFNVATDDGGGIRIFDSELSIDKSTVSSNTAGDDGGGVNIVSGSFSMTNSTISSNYAGPGQLESVGGGVRIFDSTGSDSITIVNSTITRNSTSGDGGGLRIDAYSSVTLENTIISGNNANGLGNEISMDPYDIGLLTSNSKNLLGSSAQNYADAFYLTVGSSVSADLLATIGGNAQTSLGNIIDTTLTDNGGPTRTHAPAPNSPALDAGDNTNCGPGKDIDTDQRGIARSDGLCDIGAVEGAVDNSTCFVVPTSNNKVAIFCL